jgi:hypothetical protein
MHPFKNPQGRPTKLQTEEEILDNLEYERIINDLKIIESLNIKPQILTYVTSTEDYNLEYKALETKLSESPQERAKRATKGT